jgi:hypothetical protein
MLKLLRVSASHQTTRQRKFHSTAFLGMAAAAAGGGSGKKLVHELNDSTFPKFLVESNVPVIADFYAEYVKSIH